MSNKGNAIVSILVFILGVVFIYFFDGDTVPRSIVFLCGLAFALPALILLLSTFFTGKQKHSAGYRGIQIVCGVGGLGLGACIMLMPDVFRPLLIYPFAVLLIVGGAFQVLLISHRNRPVDYPSWMYVIPIVVIIAGVVMLCVEQLRNPANERWVVLITGISAVLYGFNGLMVSVMGHRRPARGGEAKGEDTPAVAAGTEEKPEKPKEEKPTEEKTSEEHPSEEKSAGEKSAGEEG